MNEEGSRNEERRRAEMLGRLRMTRWESAAASFLPVTVQEGDGDYVTGAPPPACCTRPAVCKHTHIKHTLALAASCIPTAHTNEHSFQ